MEGTALINDHEFEFHNAHCFKIDVPQIGSAQAIYYDVAALKDVLRTYQKKSYSASNCLYHGLSYWPVLQDIFIKKFINLAVKFI